MNMKIKLHRLIKEQFNINDLDFSADSDMDTNIFNKDLYIDPQEIYDKIIKNQHVFDYEIKYLNSKTGAVKTSDNDIYAIADFYSSNYPYDSLNWLDVSDVTNMSQMFKESLYNGDISMWDVSNVEHMSEMFCDSEFTGDISNWNVSMVKDMPGMFKYSQFNGDISNWDVSMVNDMSCMF